MVVLSRALGFEQVFDEYVDIRKRYSDLSVLPTRAFLEGLEVDKEAGC